MPHSADNSPCLPPHFDQCFGLPLMQWVLVTMDHFMGNSRSNIIRQAWMHRIGVWPTVYTAAESIQYAQEKMNLTTVSELYSIVENDQWMYNTTRTQKDGTIVNATGPSMVCNVFVCNMLKNSGAFGEFADTMECGESTIRTLYSAKMWDESRMYANRPEICKTTDPNNSLCQLMGGITLNLHPELNSVPVHTHQADHCPSVGPNYIMPEDC